MGYMDIHKLKAGSAGMDGRDGYSEMGYRRNGAALGGLRDKAANPPYRARWPQVARAFHS